MACESRWVMSNSLQPHGPYSPWNSPGQNTQEGRCSLLQGIVPTQGSSPGILHCRWILYQLNYHIYAIIQETVKDKESWQALVLGVAKSWTWFSDWKMNNKLWPFLLHKDKGTLGVSSGWSSFMWRPTMGWIVSYCNKWLPAFPWGN